MKFLFYIFVLCFCCNGYCGSKTLNLENLFKRGESIYSTESDIEEQRKLAEKAAKNAELAKLQYEERNKITIIEVNINWGFVSLYYGSFILLSFFYFWTQAKKKP